MDFVGAFFIQQLRPIRRALLSVSDKTGILEFATALTQLNIELLSTGGRAKICMENNIPVTAVSDYTDFPEMMDGRVKTLPIIGTQCDIFHNRLIG